MYKFQTFNINDKVINKNLAKVSFFEKQEE